jgi:hypothetical protein
MVKKPFCKRSTDLNLGLFRIIGTPSEHGFKFSSINQLIKSIGCSYGYRVAKHIVKSGDHDYSP